MGAGSGAGLVRAVRAVAVVVVNLRGRETYGGIGYAGEFVRGLVEFGNCGC